MTDSEKLNEIYDYLSIMLKISNNLVELQKLYGGPLMPDVEINISNNKLVDTIHTYVKKVIEK